MAAPIDQLPKKVMRVLRALVSPLWWIVLIALTLSASVAFHFDHALTRIVARDLTNNLVSDLIKGRLELGAVDVLTTEHVIAHDVSFYDAEGRRVIWAEEVELGFDLAAARAGTLRFSRGIIRRGEVELLRGEGDLPSVIEAFEPVEPGDGEGESLHAVVDNMALEDVRLTGEVLGLEGIVVPALSADGRLEAHPDGYLEIRVGRARGTMTEPFPWLGHVDRLSARIHTDPLEGVVLRTSGRVEREDGPTDRLAVRVTYKVPEGGERDDPQELEILVHADPAEAQILAELGYEWAELFDSRLEGWFRLRGDPAEAMEMSVDADTEGGHARITGTLGPDGNVRIEGQTDGLELSRFVRDSPELEVAGRGSMEIDGSDPDGPPRVSIELEAFSYEGWAVPALRGEGVLLEESVRIDRVSAPYAGGTIRGSGEVGFDGATNLRVRGTIPDLSRDRNVRRILPEIEGSATIDARLETFGPDRPELDFNGTIILRNVRYGELVASYLKLSGSARGAMERPRLNLDVEGQDVAVAGYPLGAADASVSGGPATYAARGTFRTEDGRALELAANATRSGSTWELNADNLVYRYHGGTWNGTAQRVLIDPDRFVEIQGARLESGGQRLEGWGTFRFSGPDELQALLVDFDIAALRALVGDAIPDVGGRADAHVRLSGDVSRPELLIEGALRNGHLQEVDQVNASYLIEYADGNLTYDASMDLGERGNLSMAGTGLLDPTIPNPFDALEGGFYEMELQVNGLDIDVVHRLAETALPPGINGHLQGRLSASGPVFAPNLEMELGIYRLLVPGMSPLNVNTELSYQSGSLVGSISLADERGALAELEGSVIIDLINLLMNPEETVESLGTLPWTVNLTIPPRLLRDVPPEFRSRIPEELHPFQAGLRGTFAGGGFATRGDVVVEAEWTGAAVYPLCEAGVNTRFEAVATLRDGHSTIATRVLDGETELGTLDFSGPTPFDAWIAGELPFEMPPTRIGGVVQGAPIENLPYLCEYGRGPITAVLQADNLFTNQPTLHAEAITTSASIMDTAAVRSDIELDIDSSGARLLGAVAWWTGERAGVELAFPVTWNREHWIPEPDGSDIIFLAEAESAPLAPFISWLPQIAFATGYVTGNVEARGSLEDLDIRGAAGLHDGYIELRGLGQHLHDVEGDVEFNGNWARLRGIRAYDGDGSIRVDGSIGFDGIFPARARFSLNSRNFPVRSEGSVLATLSGSAGIEADISGEETEMDIEVRNLNVQLPDDSTRTVQALEDHPDVRIVGLASRELGDEEPYPFRIHVDAQRPFWVRRNDFAAQIAADLVATYRDPDLYLSGYAEMRRGFFEVFGKRFAIERGSMNFDGDDEIDPEVNLVAVHDMRSPPNTQVTVVVHGTLSAPEIEFSSNHRDCDERAEIISMLVSGRCGTPSGDTSNLEFNAYEQASDFLAGIAAGLLTLTARKEFGDVLPVIVIESGDQAFQSARVRAGFQANDVIPDFLDDVVQGAYIEGIFTAGSNTSDDNASLLPGVLIELSFPYSLVTTGEYTPPNNWSVDITWEP